jgi:hypothetical protein
LAHDLIQLAAQLSPKDLLLVIAFTAKIAPDLIDICINVLSTADVGLVTTFFEMAWNVTLRSMVCGTATRGGRAQATSGLRPRSR